MESNIHIIEIDNFRNIIKNANNNQILLILIYEKLINQAFAIFVILIVIAILLEL